MSTTIVQNNFIPTSIPGCKLWLDAADTSSVSMTLSGTSVTTWKDKSGNGLNMTAGGNYPTYTTTGVQFNGGLPTVLSNASGYSGTTALTTFVVYRSTVAGSRQRVFKCAKNGNYNVSQVDTNFIDLETTSTANYQGPISYSANTTYLISAVAYSAPSISWAINGTESFTWTNATGSGVVYSGPTELEVGGVTTVYFTGYIMEVIMYDAFFTQSQRQQVEGYLAWKWGLQGSLPSNHLYKNSPGVFVTQPITLASLNITNRINKGSFLPTSIPSCKLWVDGADPAGTGVAPANGSTVSTWVDKSGLGNNATSGASAVTYSSLGLSFGGSSYYSVPGIAGTIVNTPFVIFIVETLATTGGSYYFGDDNVNNSGAYGYSLHTGYRTSTNQTFAMYGSDLEDTTVSGTGNKRIWALYLPTASNRNTRRNGSVDVTFSNYNRLLAFTAPVIGRIFGSAYYTGTISEIIVYNQDIGLSAIKQVEGYLAWKWGIQVNLAPDHPYKYTSAVFVTQPTTLAALALNPYNSMFISSYFNPRSISGLQFWIDAADRTSMTFASANTISAWNDKSGNGYNLSQSTSAYQPTYSSNYINLGTASNYYMNIPQAAVNNASSWTMFFVINPINSTNWIMAKQWDGVNTLNILSLTYNGFRSSGTTNVLYFKAQNAATLFTGPSALSLNTVQLISMRYDGTNMQYYLNGNLGSTTAGSFGILSEVRATSCTLGAWIVSAGLENSGTTNFNLGELQFFNNAITTAQRQQIEGYLAWKWGIQGSLPSTNPYKNYPPPP